jgi:dihydrofolate reductase
MTKFNIIAAVSLNGVIGDSVTNTIPWYLPSDLKHFKNVTQNGTVVMGSRTFRSIGKVLPNRRNVVITRAQGDIIKELLEMGVNQTYTSIREAIKHEYPNFFVIGGQHIYQEAFKARPSRLYLTIVKIEAQGDVIFPITGSMLLNDQFTTSNNVLYVCEKRSEWFDDNGIQFQFTEFVPHECRAY